MVGSRRTSKVRAGNGMDIGIPRTEILTAGSKKAQQKSAIRPTSTAVSLWDLSHQANILSANFRLERQII